MFSNDRNSSQIWHLNRCRSPAWLWESLLRVTSGGAVSRGRQVETELHGDCSCVCICMRVFVPVEWTKAQKQDQSWRALRSTSKSSKSGLKKANQERRANGKRAKSEVCNNVRFSEKDREKSGRWVEKKKNLPATTTAQFQKLVSCLQREHFQESHKDCPKCILSCFLRRFSKLTIFQNPRLQRYELSRGKKKVKC